MNARKMLDQILEEFGDEPSAGGSVSSGSAAGGAAGQGGIEPKSRDYKKNDILDKYQAGEYSERVKPLVASVTWFSVEEIAELVEAIYDQRGADLQLSGKVKKFILDTLPLTDEEKGP